MFTKTYSNKKTTFELKKKNFKYSNKKKYKNEKIRE